MAFWDFLTVGKNAEKALDIVDKAEVGIIAGIDKVWFTNEEKSEMHQKMIETHLELVKTLVGENSAQHLTRRWLSFMFCGTFLSFLVATGIVWKFDPKWAEQIFALAETLSQPVMAVIIFYYGLFAVDKFTKAKGDK